MSRPESPANQSPTIDDITQSQTPVTAPPHSESGEETNDKRQPEEPENTSECAVKEEGNAVSESRELPDNKENRINKAASENGDVWVHEEAPENAGSPEKDAEAKQSHDPDLSLPERFPEVGETNDLEPDVPLKSNGAVEKETPGSPSDPDDYDPAEALSIPGGTSAGESTEAARNPSEQSKAENCSDDDDYDPESSITPKTSVSTLPAKPASLPAVPKSESKVIPDLREAYEAVMQSDIVQSKEFSELSKEKQMIVIEKLLSEKNISLPRESGAQVEGKHPAIDRSVTEEEEQEYQVFNGHETEPQQEIEENSRLFVGNLPSNHVSRFEVFRVFNQYGKVADITIKAGFGFVQYFSAKDCEAAIKGENGATMCGRVLRLDTSRSRKDPQLNARARERCTVEEQPSKRRKTADIKIFTCEDTDADFLCEIERALNLSHVTFETTKVEATKVSESIQDAAYSGVLCACVVRDNQAKVQTFENTDDGIRFDEYEDVEPYSICNIALNAKKQEEEAGENQDPEGIKPNPDGNHTVLQEDRTQEWGTQRGNWSRRENRGRNQHDKQGRYANDLAYQSGSNHQSQAYQNSTQKAYQNHQNSAGNSQGHPEIRAPYNRKPYNRNSYNRSPTYNGDPAFNGGHFPSYGQPAYGQPSYGQPAYGQPAYGQPAYGQPAYGQPAYNQGYTQNSMPPAYTNGQTFQGFRNQGYPNQSIPNQGYPNQGFPNQSPPNQGFPSFPNQGNSSMYAINPSNQGTVDMNATQALQNLDPNTKQKIIALLQNPNAAGQGPVSSAGQADSVAQTSSQVNHLLSQLQGSPSGHPFVPQNGNF